MFKIEDSIFPLDPNGGQKSMLFLSFILSPYVFPLFLLPLYKSIFISLSLLFMLWPVEIWTITRLAILWVSQW